MESCYLMKPSTKDDHTRTISIFQMRSLGHRWLGLVASWHLSKFGPMFKDPQTNRPRPTAQAIIDGKGNRDGMNGTDRPCSA